MPISINPQMMRQIIMDHYENPRNKRRPSDSSYLMINMDSVSCIDNIDIYIKVVDGKVLDCCFEGVACTISTASTSIMTELLIGKSLKDAQKIIDSYNHMIHEEPFDEDLLEEAIVFVNTSKQASRIKCATIGWNGVEELLKRIEGDEHE